MQPKGPHKPGINHISTAVKTHVSTHQTCNHFSSSHFLSHNLPWRQERHTQWRPWDLLMFAAAVLWIHKRPWGTPGEHRPLDTPFVKMAGKCAGGLAMQLKGDTSMNMYFMLMLRAEAVDSSCWWKQRTCSRITTLWRKRCSCRRTLCHGGRVVTGGRYQWQATKVTPLNHPSGPSGVWGSANLLSLQPPWPFAVRHSEVKLETP